MRPVALASILSLPLCHCERAPPPLVNSLPDSRVEPVEAPPTAVSATASARPPSAPTVTCARDDTFPSPWKVPEASAAAEVELRPGIREILVIGDSGRNGAAMAWSRAGGTRALVLPLDDKASDDLEGMVWQKDAAGARLDTLTSSGAVRTFVPDGKGGLRADGETYRLGASPISCPDLHGVNCGKNWEGLCLRSPAVRARCAGYAASKTETALYCVQRDDTGHLSVDPLRLPLVLTLDRLTTRQGVLSDCAFGAPGGPAEDVLLVTTNVFGGSQTYIVDEATGRATALDAPGTLSNEAIAVDHEGALYAFLDDNGETSGATRFVCQGWGR